MAGLREMAIGRLLCADVIAAVLNADAVQAYLQCRPNVYCALMP